MLSWCVHSFLAHCTPVTDMTRVELPPGHLVVVDQAREDVFDVPRIRWEPATDLSYSTQSSGGCSTIEGRIVEGGGGLSGVFSSIAE